MVLELLSLLKTDIRGRDSSRGGKTSRGETEMESQRQRQGERCWWREEEEKGVVQVCGLLVVQVCGLLMEGSVKRQEEPDWPEKSRRGGE